MTPRAVHAEQATYTRVALDPPFDIIRARYVRQKFVTHAHSEYAIGVVDEGCGRLDHAHGSDDFPAGTVIAIPAGLAHSGCAADKEGWSYRMLYLPTPYLERAAERAGFPAGALPWFPRVALDDDELADRLIGLHLALEESHEHPSALAGPLDDALRDLAHRHGEERRDDSASETSPSTEVQAVRAFIDASFTRPISIDEMSRVAELSPFYLIRAFRRAYGLPPYTYVEQLRVQRARELIERGANISTAAFEAGFSDQSHLTRRFKRTFGITPGVIARRPR